MSLISHSRILTTKKLGAYTQLLLPRIRSNCGDIFVGVRQDETFELLWLFPSDYRLHRRHWLFGLRVYKNNIITVKQYCWSNHGCLRQNVYEMLRFNCVKRRAAQYCTINKTFKRYTFYLAKQSIVIPLWQKTSQHVEVENTSAIWKVVNALANPHALRAVHSRRATSSACKNMNNHIRLGQQNAFLHNER